MSQLRKREDRIVLQYDLESMVGAVLDELDSACQTEASTVADLMRDMIDNTVLYESKTSADEAVKQFIGVAEELKAWAQEFIDRVKARNGLV
jgi:hypothetical protein